MSIGWVFWKTNTITAASTTRATSVTRLVPHPGPCASLRPAPQGPQPGTVQAWAHLTAVFRMPGALVQPCAKPFPIAEFHTFLDRCQQRSRKMQLHAASDEREPSGCLLLFWCRPGLELNFSFGAFVPGLQFDGAFAFGVDLHAQQDGDVGDPDPYE
jgi:hypothetical protein